MEQVDDSDGGALRQAFLLSPSLSPSFSHPVLYVRVILSIPCNETFHQRPVQLTFMGNAAARTVN